ncbi:BnaA03g00660D [Brassica napus]|nr:BnaA03g00660D [Brassica napus]
MMNLSAIQNLLPPNIAVPSGWKPGMPVELPPAPRALEQQQMRPPPGLHRPPDVIQVRAVQLDILESDNSSDDASSDDEE